MKANINITLTNYRLKERFVGTDLSLILFVVFVRKNCVYINRRTKVNRTFSLHYAREEIKDI